MINLFYIVICIGIIGIAFCLVKMKYIKNIAKHNIKQIEYLKKKFNIKSTEKTNLLNKKINNDLKSKSSKSSVDISELLKGTSSYKIALDKKKINIPNIDVIPLPNYTEINDQQLDIVPRRIIKKIQNIVENSDLNIYNIVQSFINSKILFEKIFLNEDGNKKINSINSFLDSYKKINMNDNQVNIVLKLYDNKDNEKFIIMKDNKLIKINKLDDYKILDSLILKEKIFMMVDKNNYFICYGDSYTSEINSNQIKNIFFNKLDINDQKNKSNFDLFNKFNHLSIFYWISTKVDYSA